MENVNAVIRCYETVINNATGILEYRKPIDVITAYKTDGDYYTTKFYVVVHMNLLGKDGAVKELFDTKGKLKCKLRLTKCSDNVCSRICADLKEFTLDIKELIVDQLVYPYLNFVYLADGGRIRLQGGTGHYVLQLLIQTSDKETEWEIQAMTELLIL